VWNIQVHTAHYLFWISKRLFHFSFSCKSIEQAHVLKSPSHSMFTVLYSDRMVMSPSLWVYVYQAMYCLWTWTMFPTFPVTTNISVWQGGNTSYYPSSYSIMCCRLNVTHKIILLKQQIEQISGIYQNYTAQRQNLFVKSTQLKCFHPSQQHTMNLHINKYN
jgi:hypothetical protein